MAPGVSNGLVTGDVTRPERSVSWHKMPGTDYLENGWRDTLGYDFT